MNELTKTTLSVKDLAFVMDPSALAINASYEDMYEMVEYCKQYDFGCSFTWPAYYPEFSAALKGTNTAFGASLAFPSGQEPTFIKQKQAEWFMTMDAVEVDMVMNVGWLRSKRFKEAADDIRAVRDVIGSVSLKVIIEAMQLTDEEIVNACNVCLDAGADYVKSGSGFSHDPTTLHHVELIKETIGDRAKIKVAGGVRDLKTLLQMYKRGARRYGIGFRNAVRIMETAMRQEVQEFDTELADEMDFGEAEESKGY